MSKIDEMTDTDVQEQLRELYTALDADTLRKAKAYEYNAQQISAINEVLDGLGAPQKSSDGRYLTPAARLTSWLYASKATA